MEIFGKGRCAGAVTRAVQKGEIMASVSAYDSGNFNDSWHYHESARMSLVLRGGCSEKKKSDYERVPGTVTFYMAGEPHKISRIHSSIHVNLEIEDGFFSRQGISEKSFSRAIERTPDAKIMLVKLYKEMLEEDDFTGCSAEMLLLEFLDRSAARNEDKQLPAWLPVVHQLLHDRWDETPSLKDLSEETGVHPVTISRYFPKYFSCTLGAYMRKLKVEKALTLIKERKTSLTAIAYECGFADQSHFIHTFKNVTGYLPAKYQQL